MQRRKLGLTTKDNTNGSHRRTSQKPSDDLYKHFKASFPQLQLNANTKAVAPSTLTDAPDDPAELRYARLLRA